MLEALRVEPTDGLQYIVAPLVGHNPAQEDEARDATHLPCLQSLIQIRIVGDGLEVGNVSGVGHTGLLQFIYHAATLHEIVFHIVEHVSPEPALPDALGKSTAHDPMDDVAPDVHPSEQLEHCIDILGRSGEDDGGLGFGEQSPHGLQIDPRMAVLLVEVKHGDAAVLPQLVRDVLVLGGLAVHRRTPLVHPANEYDVIHHCHCHL